MLSKEQLNERLSQFKEKVNFQGDELKFWEFISLNFEIDSFFILNILSGDEILELIDDRDKFSKINETFSNLLEDKMR